MTSVRDTGGFSSGLASPASLAAACAPAEPGAPASGSPPVGAGAPGASPAAVRIGGVLYELALPAGRTLIRDGKRLQRAGRRLALANRLPRGGMRDRETERAERIIDAILAPVLVAPETVRQGLSAEQKLDVLVFAAQRAEEVAA